jgi:hypothetical protein
MTRTALLFVFALGACDLQLVAATAPPPGATAVLDNDDKIISLSRGVALGIDCRDGSQLCTGMVLEVDDPAIAAAYPSFDTELDFTHHGLAPRTSLVVVGLAEGNTALHVDAEDGSVSYEVRVLRE